MINPVWLRSFCTLVEVAHFTRTAEQLNMTQSGVSQHIRKLEEHLGQALLVREGKRFTLTGAGERLYQEGRELLRSLESIEARLGDDPAYEGIVRVASPGSVGLKLYRQLLALQQRYPKLVIDYRFAPNSEVESLVARHKIDVGLMSCQANSADVCANTVGEEELLLLTPLECELPTWQNLLGLGFIDHPDGAHHASTLLGANFSEFQHYSQFRRGGFSNQIALIAEPVSLGLGFTVLPRYAVAAFPGREKIRVHQLNHKVSETLYLARHRQAVNSARVKTVLAEIESCLKNKPV